MSLATFKAKNHVQQVQKRGALNSIDERFTPNWLWEKLHAKHRFTVDVAASVANSKTPRFYDLSSDGLKQSWANEVVWCNPPFSNLEGWVQKAMEEVFFGDCKKVVMLLPANRTEQPFWQKNIEPIRDRGQGVTVEFIARRIQFGTPENPDGKYKSSPPFGCCLVIIEALR